MNSNTKNLIYVSIGTCCFWLSLYLYVPILPIHSTELGANLKVTGFIIASYALGQLIFRIPIGILSDIFSRKLFTIISFTLCSLGALILGLSENPNQLLLGRSITGIAAAGWVSLTVLFLAYLPRKWLREPSPLHVGLAGENEYFDFAIALRGSKVWWFGQ